MTKERRRTRAETTSELPPQDGGGAAPGGSGPTPHRAAKMDARARRAPGWIARHPRGAWYTAVSIVAAALYAVAAPVGAAVYGIPVLAALFLPLAQALAIVAVVRLPWASIGVFAVAAAAESLWAGPDTAPWPWNATAIIGYVVLTGAAWAAHGWRVGIAALLAPAVAVTVPIALSFTGATLASAIVALALGVVSAAVGWLLSDRIRIAGELSQERALSGAETERRLVVEERQRIAREMHDVVAHGLSLIQVQAATARYRLPGIDDPAAREFDDIAASARTSLAEMRRLLGALRGDDEAAEHAPQPGLGDIPDLVEDSRRAGARVGLAFDASGEAGAAVGIAAYRIVQEGISNAMRHAPGAPIEVRVSRDDERVRLEIANPVPDGAPAPAERPGHGLVGMRERAALLGGSLEAGRTATGRFRVAASLPLGAGAGQTTAAIG